MGATLGNHDSGSRNVELNIVPFIDLMSCLTAFLLVTAVWVNISSLDNAPHGRTREFPSDVEPPRLAILLDQEHITVSSYPSGETRQMRSRDYSRLESALREFKTGSELPDVQVAADSTKEHPIEYRELIAAMDAAVRVGYPKVGVVDVRELTH
jgi:biopolymer transport protein ExbD